MSADAKLWQDERDDWCAVHDGACRHEGEHRQSAYGLVELIAEVNGCMAPMPITRWVLQVYPDGTAGLRGFTW